MSKQYQNPKSLSKGRKSAIRQVLSDMAERRDWAAFLRFSLTSLDACGHVRISMAALRFPQYPIRCRLALFRWIHLKLVDRCPHPSETIFWNVCSGEEKQSLVTFFGCAGKLDIAPVFSVSEMSESNSALINVLQKHIKFWHFRDSGLCFQLTYRVARLLWLGNCANEAKAAYERARSYYQTLSQDMQIVLRPDFAELLHDEAVLVATSLFTRKKYPERLQECASVYQQALVESEKEWLSFCRKDLEAIATRLSVSGKTEAAVGLLRCWRRELVSKSNSPIREFLHIAILEAGILERGCCLNEAEQLLMEAAEIVKKSPLARFKHRGALPALAEALGRVNRKRGQYGISLQFLRKSIQGWQRFNSPFDELRVLSEYAGLVLHTGAFESLDGIMSRLTSLIENCTTLTEDSEDPSEDVLFSIALIHGARVSLAQLHLANGEHVQAMNEFGEVEDFFMTFLGMQMPGTEAIIYSTSLIGLAQYYLNNDLATFALNTLGKSRAVLESGNYDNSTEDGYLLRFAEALLLLSVAESQCGYSDESLATAHAAMKLMQRAEESDQLVNTHLTAMCCECIGRGLTVNGQHACGVRFLISATRAWMHEFALRPRGAAASLYNCSALLVECLFRNGTAVEAGLILDALVEVHSLASVTTSSVPSPEENPAIIRVKMLAATGSEEVERTVDMLERLRPDSWAELKNSDVLLIRAVFGKCLVTSGQVEEGIKELREAHESGLELNDDSFLVERMNVLCDLGIAMHQLALKSHDEKGTRDALEVLAESTRMAEKLRGRLIDPQLKIGMQNQLMQVCHSHMDACMSTCDENRLTEAFGSAELLRNRGLFDLMTEHLLASKLADTQRPEFERLRAEAHNASQRLAEAAGELTENEHSIAPRFTGHFDTASDAQPWSDNSYLKSVLPSLSEYFNYARKISTEYDWGFNPAEVIPVTTIEQIQRLLPNERTAAIQLSVTAASGYAIVVTKAAVQGINLPGLSLDRLKEQSLEWRTSYKLYQETHDVSKWEPTVQKILSWLGRECAVPICATLTDVDQIIISASQDLHLFPIHDLPLGGESRLSDLFEISYTPSFSILQSVHDRDVPRGGHPRLFGASEPLARLPHVELLSIAQTLTAEIFDPLEVSPDKLRALSAEACVWHFAGHAYSDWKAPLSSAMQKRIRKDWLQLRSIFLGLKLPRARLVTLSGCETSLIRPSCLDEHVGFPAAFLYAGARSVVGSLWVVDGAPTALFFSRFYQNLAVGLSIAASVRSAAFWLRGRSDYHGESLRSGDQLAAYLEEYLYPIAGQGQRSLLENKFRRFFKLSSAPFNSEVYSSAFVSDGVCWEEKVLGVQND